MQLCMPQQSRDGAIVYCLGLRSESASNTGARMEEEAARFNFCVTIVRSMHLLLRFSAFLPTPALAYGFLD